jgi:hypothetical protein
MDTFTPRKPMDLMHVTHVGVFGIWTHLVDDQVRIVG